LQHTQLEPVAAPGAPGGRRSFHRRVELGESIWQPTCLLKQDRAAVEACPQLHIVRIDLGGKRDGLPEPFERLVKSVVFDIHRHGASDQRVSLGSGLGTFTRYCPGGLDGRGRKIARLVVSANHHRRTGQCRLRTCLHRAWFSVNHQLQRLARGRVCALLGAVEREQVVHVRAPKLGRGKRIAHLVDEPHGAAAVRDSSVGFSGPRSGSGRP
jgi:hypothetical protein